jgi:rod shape determining protein RodA
VSFESQLCTDGVDWRVLHDYQKQRVCTLLDPSKDPLGKGFHIIQGMIAIGSGGVGGKGFMQGTQTHLEFIPERTTDFIFAAYSEEFGLVGNLALISAFILLIFRGLAIALNATTLFSRLLAGAVTMIFFHLRLREHGHGQRHPAGGGGAAALHQLWRHGMVTLGLGLGILMSIARARKLAQN